MVFSDLFFLFVFIPAFLLCYRVAGWLDRGTLAWRNSVLVVFSLIFYAWGEPVYVFLMLGCVLMNWLAGLGISRTERHRKLALTLGLIGNLGILCTFKYLGFLTAQLVGLGVPVGVPNIALPIGISFYTFQSISYLIDVYRQEARVQRRFWDLLLYISMFPQLIAGPIVRYGTIAEEIHDRHATAQDVADGVFRFLIGLGKKVIIANQMGEVADQFLKNGIDDLSTAGAWVGIVAFTFQIYFDFSGYSDMAIGMGRCMGFHFNENFNHPYISRSITEFWRRWHMSLGSFFRDYLYIPLGGNRRHQAPNILVVWFLTGMWHGASWNFILWGVYFGIIVMVEKYTLLKVQTKIPAVFLHLYAILLFVIGWGIFYFDDFANMGKFFTSAFAQGGELTDFSVESALFDHFWLWLLALVFCLPVRSFVTQWYDSHVKPCALKSFIAVTTKTLVSIVILVLSTALLVGATNNAFIYTRF
jgi:alginate O-acetyltransferase complex protein AlgI